MSDSDAIFATSATKYIKFGLSDSLYAVPLLEVREVIPPPQTTRIPGAENYYIGLANIRGQVISVIDLRAHLGVTPRGGANEEVVIITNIEGFNIGLLIDSLEKVLSTEDVEECTIEDLRDQTAGEYLRGVFKHEGDLVFILDLHRLLDIDIISETSKKGAL